jgi:lipoate-protein ligase A
MQGRVIISGSNTGSSNMALDEAILQSVASGNSPFTLRVYAWDPACLSLGYAQPMTDVDHSRLSDQGWELIRRPTGGKAILHTDELTYSISGSVQHPIFDGGILPSYRRLSEPLSSFLRSFDLLTITVENKAEDADSPICFEIPGAYEITVNGKKVIGSAQLRRRGAVLQHGSVPLYGDISRICQVLAFDDEQIRDRRERSLLQSAATIENLTGIAPNWDLAAKKLIEAFRTMLEIDFVEAEPTDQESALADRLVSTRYGTHSWTERM